MISYMQASPPKRSRTTLKPCHARLRGPERQARLAAVEAATSAAEAAKAAAAAAAEALKAGDPRGKEKTEMKRKKNNLYK